MLSTLPIKQTTQPVELHNFLVGIVVKKITVAIVARRLLYYSVY